MNRGEPAMALLLAAVKFAAERHRRQRRKDQDASPYINHPIDVAELLARVGGVTDIDILRAAVLHDTIEDTQTTREEVAASFGEAVAAYVCEVTDDKSLPKAQRKRVQIERAPHLSPGAKLIKLADKISNVTDVAQRRPRDWALDRCRDYLDWSEQVVAGLRGVNPALEELYDRALEDGRRNLAGQQA